MANIGHVGRAQCAGADDSLREWLSLFNDALESRDRAAVLNLFLPQAFWRDFLAFTWNLHTSEGREAIGDMLDACLARTAPRAWRMVGTAREAGDVIEAIAAFETEIGRCSAVIRLKEGRCWTLFTTMTELKGHEEAAGARRALGRPGRYQLGRKSWRHRRAMEALELGVARQPYCVIVGAGQAGVALAARLKRLDVPTLVIDRRERPSDTWRERHDSLSLHSPSWVDHMPYFPYPETWPVHPSKDQFADWLDAYAVLMELDIWTRADCKSARFVENAGEWLVEVEHQGRTVMLRPKQLVFADGLVGTPRTPVIQGAELFKGIQRHAAAHRGSEEFAGRNCVVVGAGTSAHDICAELWEAGARVTMVQRSPVIVERAERLVALFASLFGEEAKARGISTEMGDLLSASIPFRMLLQMHQQRVAELREQDADFHEQLRKAGFLLTFGEDDAGIFAQILRNPTGYYLDVGASALIIDGRIRLRSGVGISALEARHAVLSDGSRLAADLIVYATGYDRGPGPSSLSEEARRNVGLVWGFGSGVRGDPGPWEGELRNMWKPTAQPGLWFHKAGIGQSRFYSRLLALQIKARHAGLPTPVYAAPAPRADLSTASSG